MLGLVTPAKRTSDVLDGPESSSVPDGLSDPSSSLNTKRARLDGRASNGERPLLPESYSGLQTNGDTPFEGNEHKPGSIVRVALKNFVTYTASEFFPGPRLNMVIGPNGTGKSTLVCAICLGLGWKTEHLGRAKDIGEFVKHGSRDAEIEIELAADPERHSSNPVIKHHIKKEGNKSTFSLDGKPVSRKHVIELCRSFSIQVDNLCQFLPQDRVVEFAALSPVELLAQTQRAAAPEYMVQWHEKLKTLRQEQKKAQNDHQALADNLKGLESRHNLQRGDVERMRERADVQQRVAAMKLLRPVVKYRVAKAAWEQARTSKTEAQRELANLEREVEPALQALNEKLEYRNAIDKVVERQRSVVTKSEAQCTRDFQKQETLQSQIVDCQKEIDAETRTAKDQRQARVRLEAQISEIERLRAHPPPEFDPAEYNERIRGFGRRKNELEEQAREANEKQKECVEQGRIRANQVEQINRELQDMRSQAGQQKNRLRQASSDTARAWEWIQNNQSRFSGPVFGPPIVSCSVKDARHADFVESMLSVADMLAFTVTNSRDFQTLQDVLLRDQKLSDINIRSTQVALSHFNPPISSDQLQQYGLNAFLLDLIEGPEEVLTMLCDNRNIHQTGVAFRDVSNEHYEALIRSPISSFVTPKESFIITRRREYGDQGTSTRTQRLKNARFFTDQAVDVHAEQAQTRRINELEDEKATLGNEARQHKQTTVELRQRTQELKDEEAEVQSEKDEKQKAVTQFDALPRKLTVVKDKLATLDETEATYRTRLQKIRDRQDQHALDRAQAALSYALAVDTLRKLHIDLFNSELLLLEAHSDHEVLASRNVQVSSSLREKTAEVQTLTADAARLKKEAQAYHAEANKMVDERTEREQEIHDSQPDDLTPQALEIEIEGLQARIDMIHEGNPHILGEYEERGRRIERMSEKVEELVATLSRLEEEITATRSKWEPELDALVAQISQAFGDNFARIGCAGQVEVYKDEDFEDWAIQVQVKFREHEQLSILDSHRQSGGERAVSTIFYLMALQSLARAPFRVVDEINQGMDPRNERLVHSRIVSIACAENTSQYFLITPKLLPNLDYHPNMMVHCIVSGEYVPDDHRQLDLPALARKAIGLRAR